MTAPVPNDNATDATVQAANGSTQPGFLGLRHRTYVWLGVAGTALGCSAWLLAMAGMAGDWLAFGLTLALDVVLVFVIGRICSRVGAKRFHLSALMLIILTAHCLAMYWWRFDLWRASSVVTPEELLREKKIVTFTVVAMVSLLLSQFGLFYWLQSRSRKNRNRVYLGRR